MKIVNFKKIDHPTIKARFDIEFAIGTVFDFSLINTNGKKFISFPSKKYEKDGETKYKNFYYPPGGKEEGFQKQCLELLKHFLVDEAPSVFDEECPF